jgi:putative addiction module component (TIGR02574 family)
VNKATLLVEIMRLSPDERRELIDEIWDTLPLEADDFELTEEQKAELDRRLEEHERDPSSAIPWEEVIASLRSKLG